MEPLGLANFQAIPLLEAKFLGLSLPKPPQPQSLDPQLDERKPACQGPQISLNYPTITYMGSSSIRSKP